MIGLDGHRRPHRLSAGCFACRRHRTAQCRPDGGGHRRQAHERDPSQHASHVRECARPPSCWQWRARFQRAYARASSGASGSNGTSKQNYIAYAVDGVDWSAFSKEGSTGLPASYVASFSQTQVKEIWAGTLPNCTLGTGESAVSVGAMEWGCLFPPVSGKSKAAEATAATKPIDCYLAQPGSGTAGTWATYAGYTKRNSPPIGCLNDEAGDTVDTLHSAAAVNDHFNC